MKLIALNNKGQAFSTFQLLIAAVVALALLGVLMPIIANINPGTGRVIEAIKERINTQQDQPGALSLTDSLKVSGKRDKIIGTDTVTQGTGLSYDQVRFYDNGYTFDFGTLINGDLEIKNESTVTYRFGILCHSNKERLQESLNSYLSSTTPIIREDFDISDFEDGVRVCIIFPVKQ